MMFQKFRRRILLVLLLGIIAGTVDLHACSIIYYVDPSTGKIYVANNEDYWYNTKAYIQIEPGSGNEYARLWYGWDNFAQGGFNEHGLFFDGAFTPKQEIPEGFSDPNGRNVGDEILAYCSTVEQAVNYLEMEKIGVSEGHLILGDREGKAVVLEWVQGEIRIVRMKGNYLIATNFLLSETDPEEILCPRYKSMDERAKQLQVAGEEVDLRSVGNTISGAVQVPREDESGRVGGTLYSTFIDLTDLSLVVVPRLDNSRALTLDLKEGFKEGKRLKINL
jgi:choloylglycine hydrolase